MSVPLVAAPDQGKLHLRSDLLDNPLEEILSLDLRQPAQDDGAERPTAAGLWPTLTLGAHRDQVSGIRTVLDERKLKVVELGREPAIVSLDRPRRRHQMYTGIP